MIDTEDSRPPDQEVLSNENVKMKHCLTCGGDFPATTEFFTRDRHSKGGFRSECKTCRVKIRRVPEGHKRCSSCKKIFPATTEFFVRDSRRSENGLYNLCKACNRQKVQSQRDNKKSKTVGAPESNGHKQKVISDLQEIEPIIIHRCDSCGMARGNILGDIDRETHKRYGQLCAKCTDFMRISKGDPTYVNSFLTYLQRTRIDNDT